MRITEKQSSKNESFFTGIKGGSVTQSIATNNICDRNIEPWKNPFYAIQKEVSRPIQDP